MNQRFQATAIWFLLLAGAVPIFAQPPRTVPGINSTSQPAAPQSEAQEPGYLGAVLDDRSGHGILVRKVAPGGPADLAGILASDLIVFANEQRVRSMEDLSMILQDLEPGDEFEFKVSRGGRIIQMPVRLGRRPPPEDRIFPHFGQVPPQGASPGFPGEPEVGPARPRLGITASAINEEMQNRLGLQHRRGAVVTDVLPGSPADSAGLPVGAVVWAVDGNDVNSPDQLADAVMAAGPGGAILLTYFHEGDIVRARVYLTGSRANEPPDPVPNFNNAIRDQSRRPPESSDLSGDDADGLAAIREQLDRMNQRLSALEAIVAQLANRQADKEIDE